METVDAVVVGAGVVGLAVARALARSGHEVVILESGDAYGLQTSSRNSEVIHAGIYYPPGSLKARLCVEGKHALYRYCETRGVVHRRIGKLIVATAEEDLAVLEELQAKAARNGVDDLEWLSGEQATKLEPALTCRAALLSPSTGIVDSRGFMTALLGDAQECGAQLSVHTPFEEGSAGREGLRVRSGEMEVGCGILVNAGGLGAQAVARAIGGLDPATIPRRYLSKGSYFSTPGKAAFSRLIYPVPNAAGLGIHVTLDVAGQMRFGPDQEWVEQVGYDVDEGRAPRFAEAVCRYFPTLDETTLVPAFAGVRPKVQAPGEPMADFAIHGPEVHGVDGLVNLFGFESPGLTAALAIAQEVLQRLGVRSEPG
ncbi:MAG: FAD-dependent oxidoreductase [Deltaproteobacteria bacterium]|jgi:L-2-hydroxyglutarate oxidase LhgO|nr:FAD-dependent oxidoreductase [Deltaproteobacteria bacterium]